MRGQLNSTTVIVLLLAASTGSAQDGWAAVVNWEAEPTPGVKGFRLYRQVYPSGSLVQLADEATLTRTVRTFTDDTVLDDRIYSYTVAIYRPNDFYGPELELASQPYNYEVIPPLGQRDRMVVKIPWLTNYFTESLGTGRALPVGAAGEEFPGTVDPEAAAL